MEDTTRKYLNRETRLLWIKNIGNKIEVRDFNIAQVFYKSLNQKLILKKENPYNKV
jgi:hypothetical protein